MKIWYIENAKLGDLISKGLKYREPNKINWKVTENMIFESTDIYAERWAKREQDNLKYLSKWKEKLKEFVTDRISGLKGKFKRPNQKILNDPELKDCLSKLHQDLVLVPADKAVNNLIVICKTHHIDTLIKELEINSLHQINSTYALSTSSYEMVLKGHSDFVKSVE